jgi:branched-subunit amino acid ABC-type transport system permease component
MGLVALFGAIIGGVIIGLIAGLLAIFSTKEGQSKAGNFFKQFFVIGFIASIAVFALILSMYAANFP